jgi:hypothetical protein
MNLRHDRFHAGDGLCHVSVSILHSPHAGSESVASTQFDATGIWDKEYSSAATYPRFDIENMMSVIAPNVLEVQSLTNLSEIIREKKTGNQENMTAKFAMQRDSKSRENLEKRAEFASEAELLVRSISSAPNDRKLRAL